MRYFFGLCSITAVILLGCLYGNAITNALIEIGGDVWLPIIIWSFICAGALSSFDIGRKYRD